MIGVVLKNSRGESLRGFESLSLRQLRNVAVGRTAAGIRGASSDGLCDAFPDALVALALGRALVT
jgi:hypothetical protein